MREFINITSRVFQCKLEFSDDFDIVFLDKWVLIQYGDAY